MSLALKEAHKAQKKDEVPVGAVIVLNNKVIAEGHNLIRAKNDPTAHAEIVAIRKACKKIKNERLIGASLYVTLEPCSMCAGAILLARIKTLIFGATDPKTGACGSVYSILNNGLNNHELELIKGVSAAECSKILSGFFKAKRDVKKK